MASNGSITPYGWAPRQLSAAAARVLERGRAGRALPARLDARERAWETAFAVLFLAAAVAMQLWLPALRGFRPLPALLLAGLFVALLNVEFEVGEGRTHPLQLVLVPMLFVLPPRSVPLVVAAAYVSAALPRALHSRAALGRALLAISDSWFTLAPALILSCARVIAPTWSDAGVLVAALGAQLALDCVVSCGRLRLGLGVDPRPQLPMFAWTYVVDALLAPVGLLAALAARHEVLTTLLTMPLAGLMAIFASERRGRITTALELGRVVREREGRQRSILQHSADLIAIVGRDGIVQSATGAAGAVYGEPERATGSSLVAQVHPSDAALVAAFLRDVAGRRPEESPTGAFRLRYADGSWRHVEATATNLLGDDRVAGIVLMIRDVQERRAFEEQLRHRAFHDPLTGLPNRALFYDRVAHAMRRAQTDAGGCTVLFIDVDDFHLVNDRLGHAAGDELLLTACRRIQTCVSSADTLARLGGDDFGVLLDAGTAAADGHAIAERIRAAFERPATLGSDHVTLPVSIGIAVPTPGSSDPDELLRQAEVALLAAKQGGAIEVFQPDLDTAGDADETPVGIGATWFQRSREQRREVLEVLEREDAMRSVFQPIVDLRTGQISGYEALTRFSAPVDRAPDAWFAQAHRCGLGYELEARAIALALAVPGRPPGTYLSLNLSPSALTSEQIRAVLPADLHRIVIEITENELVSQSPATSAAIAELRARGARLAVDDAGSGYAGLAHLMALAPDMIKLDRTLVDGIAREPSKVALLDAFVGYAGRIGATVCAEGIETVEDLALLADLDVSHGQGYVLARPAPAWVAISAEAAECCRRGLDRIFAQDVHGDVGVRIGGGGMERLSAQLAHASEPGEIAMLHADLARELSASRVNLRFGVADGDPRRPVLAGVRAGRHLAMITVEDPSANPDELQCLRDRGAHSVLLVPLRGGGQTVGVLEAERDDATPWSRRTIVAARILANQIGGVLSHLAAARPDEDLPSEAIGAVVQAL